MKLTIDLQKYVGPKVALALFAGFCFLSYMIVWRIPDVEKHINELREDMKTTRNDVHQEMTKIDGSVRDQLKLTNLAVEGIRVSVVRLCARSRPIDKNCDLQQVMADVRTVANSQAEFVDSGSFSFKSGAQPAVVSDGLGKQLPQVESWVVQPGKGDKGELAKLILWSSAADSAHWHRDGKVLKAEFSNGTASFQMRSTLSFDDSKRLLESLNATAGALQASAEPP